MYRPEYAGVERRQPTDAWPAFALGKTVWAHDSPETCGEKFPQKDQKCGNAPQKPFKLGTELSQFHVWPDASHSDEEHLSVGCVGYKPPLKIDVWVSALCLSGEMPFNSELQVTSVRHAPGLHPRVARGSRCRNGNKVSMIKARMRLSPVVQSPSFWVLVQTPVIQSHIRTQLREHRQGREGHGTVPVPVPEKRRAGEVQRTLSRPKSLHPSNTWSKSITFAGMSTSLSMKA